MYPIQPRPICTAPVAGCVGSPYRPAQDPHGQGGLGWADGMGMQVGGECCLGAGIVGSARARARIMGR